MSLPVRTTSRVVVAVDRGDGQDYVLELAREIVPAAVFEMLGLFVENTRLLEHAKSRFAREIMLSGRERPLDVRSLERQLRAEATQARTEFEAAAARIGVPHAFQVARGDFATELLRRATEAEALIVSLTEEVNLIGHGLDAALRELIAAPLPLLLIARRGWLRGESIAMVVGHDDAPEAMLEAAARIARLSHSPIVMLATGASAAERERTTERTLEGLAERGVKGVETVLLNELTAANVAAAARAWRARLVVLPSAGPTGLAADLLGRLSSALLLVGSKPR